MLERVGMTEDVRVGTELGGYRIESVIGRGGMSSVYLAQHIRLGRKVALKLLAPELAGSERFRDRFLRESQLAASIDHPNIVPIFDADEIDGTLCIAMRYVEGSDLKELIRSDGPLPAGRTVAIVAQVASALDAAHERGLVHRDVKPGNVLLTPEDHVYVSDFGLTKRALSVSGLTATGQLVGTIDYVAPEHIKGDPVDGRADVYSLGCVIVECLTGHVPYPRDLEVGVLWAHVEDPPPTVTIERPDLPPEVDDVVASAMAKRPDERTATAGDVATGLRSACLLEAPASEMPTRPTKRPTRRPTKRPTKRPQTTPRRKAAYAAAALVLGAALTIGVVLVTGGAGDRAPVPAANSVARIDGDEPAFTTLAQVGEDPTGVAIGEDGDVWVINQGDSTVNRIDPETGEVTPAKSTLGIPTGIAAGEGSLWITNGFGSQNGTQVVRVDPANDSVEAAFPSDNAKDIVFAFGSIWLADADRDRVLRYDPDNGSGEPIAILVDDDGVADSAPRAIAVGDGAGAGIWVVNELDDTVIRIDPDSNEVTDRLQVDGATGVAAGDSGVWVTSETNDSVHRFDPTDGRPLRTFQRADGVPDGPTTIVIAPNGVWVGSGLEPAVVVIDPATNVVHRFRLGGITGGMAVDGNGDVWVTVRVEQA